MERASDNLRPITPNPEYAVDLANRAYERLFSERTFSFDGLRHNLLTREATIWQKEIDDQREHDHIVREEYEEEKYDSWEADYVCEIDEKWNAYTEIDAADRAWFSLYADRPYNLRELRDEVCEKEIDNWRDEIEKLSEEDRVRSLRGVHETEQENHTDLLQKNEPAIFDKIRQASMFEIKNILYTGEKTSSGENRELNQTELNSADDKDFDVMEGFLRRKREALDDVTQEFEYRDPVLSQIFDKPDRFSENETDQITQSKSFEDILFGEQPPIQLNELDLTQIELQIDRWQTEAFNPDLIKEQVDRSQLPEHDRENNSNDHGREDDSNEHTR